MKTVILYITLVGILFFGLLTVLNLGKNLKAPTNIAGIWIIKPNFADEAKKSCVPIFFKSNTLKFSIEQSGIYLKGKFNDASNTILDGRFTGNKITFSKIISVSKTLTDSCGKETLVKLNLLVIQHKDGSAELSGAWTTPQCSMCKPVNISGFRETGE